MPTSDVRGPKPAAQADGKPPTAGRQGKQITAPPPRPPIATPGLAMQRNGKASWFTSFAHKTAHLAGKPVTFLLAAATIVVWAVTGPLFGYSDTWQLVINTGTTIVTFLMVFLIQNSQNRDALAFQVKLDELIIKLHGAGNEIAGAGGPLRRGPRGAARDLSQARRPRARHAGEAPRLAVRRYR